MPVLIKVIGDEVDGLTSEYIEKLDAIELDSEGNLTGTSSIEITSDLTNDSETVAISAKAANELSRKVDALTELVDLNTSALEGVDETLEILLNGEGEQ